MKIRTVHSRDHHGRPEFRPYVDGQHAILLESNEGHFEGELIWRLANIGQGIAEISGLGIQDPAQRRRGWATRMLDVALADIRAFMVQHEITPRCVYLFANAEDPVANMFYEATGFRRANDVPKLFARGTACIYVRDL